SQTSTLAPSTPVVPLHDPSYLSTHPPPSIPPSPPIPSPTTSSSPPPSPDLPTDSNPIPPDTSAPLRRSTRTKQPPAWHKDYEMSSGANHLTSSSSPGTGTRQNLKPMTRQLATLYGSRL
ncbi:proline-rich receptor-like protein kinase PERK2, partial [Cucurbita maxima]|uniref:Proline-rich receptor-like protein kinase PERK2 n=1 Tax=Cucurbita maxima TaxID=3661 RepID=A0A6J1I9V2_CUCMA